MYEVFTERAAERDLRRLSVEDFHRVVPRIRALAMEPRPSGCRKLVGSSTDWRIRVGDLRVLYRIDDRTMSVFVFRVRHRGGAYR